MIPLVHDSELHETSCTSYNNNYGITVRLLQLSKSQNGNMKSTKREKRGQTQEGHKGKRHVQRGKRFVLIGLHIIGKVRDTWKIN